MRKRMNILKAMLLSVAMLCTTLLPADLVSAAEPEAAEVIEEAEAIETEAIESAEEIETEAIESAEAIDVEEVIETEDVTAEAIEDAKEVIETEEAEEVASYEEETILSQDAPNVKYQMVYNEDGSYYKFTDVNYGSSENYQMSFTSTKAGTYLLDFNFWDPDNHYAPDAWWFGWGDANDEDTIPVKYVNDNGYYSLTKMYITMKANETIYLYWEFDTANGCDGYVNISYIETIGDAGPQVYSSYNKTTKTLTLTGEGITWDTLNALAPALSQWEGKEWNVGGDIEHLVIGEGITRLGAGIFFNGNGEFNNLKDIDFPTTLDEIGNYAFGIWNNGNKVEFELPYGLNELETGSLCGLFERDDSSYTNLIEVNIPSTVCEMGYDVFTNNLRQVPYITLVSDSDYVEQWANDNDHPFKRPVPVDHTMIFKDGKNIGDNTYEISMKVGETYPIAEHVLFDGKVMKTARYYVVGPVTNESKPADDYAEWNDDFTAITAKKAGTIYFSFNSKDPYWDEYGYDLKINITQPVTAPAATAIASLTNTATGITVKWNKVAAATGYVIYRSDNGAAYKQIATVKGCDTLSYTDTASLTNGTKYQYKIKTYTTVDGTTAYSADSTVKTTYRIARPAISSLANTSTGITVKWGKIANATGYVIYRSDNGAAYKKIGTVTGSATVSYTDTTTLTNGTKYQYKIRAYRTVSGTTYNSEYSAVKTTYRIARPAISSLTNTSTGITVKWGKIANATGYVIYRSDNGAAYKKVGTVTGSATVSYTDTTTLTNGTKYQYKIRANRTVSGTTYNSEYSTVKTTYRLTRPVISSLTNVTGSKMTVKYGRNAKATGYKIQYSTSSTFASGVKTVSVTSNSTVSKTISSLTKGKTYYVRMRAYKTVSGTTYYSAYSAKKSVKISK